MHTDDTVIFTNNSAPYGDSISFYPFDLRVHYFINDSFSIDGTYLSNKIITFPDMVSGKEFNFTVTILDEL